VERALAFLLISTVACGAGAPKAPSRSAAAESRHFRPPPDGRLTESEVAAYVRGLRAEPARRVSAAEGGMGEPSPDAEAARRAGLSEDEYAWVKERITATRVEAAVRRAARANLETYRRAIAGLRQVLAAAGDAPTRQMASARISELERQVSQAQRQALGPADPALAANAGLVERLLPKP
jgi:hypothetical protein